MTKRGLRKYVEDLLADRRPNAFDADDFESAQIRAAIELRAAREGAEQPRPEFVDALKHRIAAQMSDEDGGTETVQNKIEPIGRGSSPTRRQVVLGTTAAATVAVAAVAVDRMMIRKSEPAADISATNELVPHDGKWQRVASSAELAEGDVRSFDLGAVNGFLRRVNGRVEAVSGVCTHQGCRLWFDQSADRLRCPCHVTSFSPAGQVLTHQLPIAPNPLPQVEVREHAGVIEVLAPPSQPT